MSGTSRLRNGDIVLVDRRSQGLVSVAVKLGGQLRYGRHSPHARYSHAAIVYDADDQDTVRIVEATSSGVHVAFLSKYGGDECDVIHTGVDEHDWRQVKAFLDDVLDRRTTYGYLTYFGLTLYALTGSRLCIQEAGTAICSGLVCDALTRSRFIWRRPPYACTPADISAQLEAEGETATGACGSQAGRRSH